MHINLDKSVILPVGRVEVGDLLAAELGCKLSSLPSNYLGIPLGAKHKSKAVRDRLEEKFSRRLAL